MVASLLAVQAKKPQLGTLPAVISIYFHCTLSKTLVRFCFSGNTKTECCITFIMRLPPPPPFWSPFLSFFPRFCCIFLRV